eukprot:scpid107557/ scgid24509/ 
MMLFGQELRLPADVVFGLPPHQQSCESAPAHVLTLQNSLRSIHARARVSDDAIHAVQKDYFDTKAAGTHFTTDDIVWLLDSVIPSGSGQKKLHRPWKGPYRVIRNRHPVYDLVRVDHTGSSTRVHFNRLKKCFLTGPALPTEDQQPAVQPLAQSAPPLSHSPFIAFPDDEGPAVPAAAAPAA